MKSGGISRRDALRAGASLGVLPYFSPREKAKPKPQGRGGSFAYFSDSHVSLQRNVAECRAMLEEMGKAYAPGFAINGGDVVDYGWKGEYDSYDTVLAGLPWKTHHIPGNHDVRWAALGLKIFADRVGRPFRSFEAFGVKFLLLDSTVPLSHYGHYESEQLRWAEHELKNAGETTPVIVATHHWVGRDSVMIDNETALMRVLEPYNVKLILTGHGHSDLLWDWDAALCTMNKGLYQGSYQRVDVDWEKQQIRLLRRTTANPTLTLIAEAPLKTPREKRRIWGARPPKAVDGVVVIPEASFAKEWRLDDGAWRSADRRITLQGESPGTHLLTFRESEKSRFAVFPVHLEGSEKVREAWRAKLPGGVMSHLVLAEGRLFVSCMDGSVFAFDPDSGKQQFRAKTKGYCHSSPDVGEGLLVVGSADGSVHAFDAQSGEPKWAFPTSGPVYATAAIAKGLAMIGSGDGNIYGLNVKDGKPKWTYTMPAGNTAFTQSIPQTDGERFYFGAWDRYTYALTVENGLRAWSQLCTTSTFAFSPAIGGPAMDDKAIYIPANGNELYAFRKEDGRQLWKYQSPGDKVGYSAPCLANGRIYIGCLGDKGEARCVDAGTGTEVWCAKVRGVIYDSSPAHSEGIVAVGSVNGTLNLIDARDGSMVAEYRMPTGHFLSSPAMKGRRVFAATYSDELICLDVA